ncbi:MAG: urea ABC transporter ATP-binding subunit UrtE [Pseudomonadales bacterium]|nr:urea ABC transporter ATP-binding subunit UrtE [Pseudomonadales bacterium]
MLKVSGLNQYYDESHILWDLSMDAAVGSCTCIMGRNGVGKTTLLKSIMGLLPIRSGKVLFDGKDLTKEAAENRARLGIGYVPQGREIFGQLTVEENLKIALGANRNKTNKIPEKIYELFPVLKEMLQRKGGDLSGGQQQQLAIGRALVLEPRLLILDEPCEGIQPNIVSQIGDVIKLLNKEENISVIMVEQKLAFARRIADQFCIIEKGRNVANGTIDELSDDLVNQYLTV